MRTLLAVYALGHALAHLPGFLVGWQLRVMPELPYRTTIFSGAWDVGVQGTRFLGTAWLIATAAFALTAIGLLLSLPAAVPAAYGAIVLSTLLCATLLPEARFGLAANAGLLVLLWLAANKGWLL